MRTVARDEIQRAISFPAAIDAMREALLAQSRGECDTPMPMHLGSAGEQAEVHIKSSYRRGGKYFALKAAGSFPGRAAVHGTSNTGMMLLCSATTGDPVAFFLDEGWLTDVRTAAVAAMAARELRRADRVLGILGTGVQAGLLARLHAEVLPLEQVIVWGRSAAGVEAFRRELAAHLPKLDVIVAATPAQVAQGATLIVTATAARAPLLARDDLQPQTMISAVGSDTPGKQELDPGVLIAARVLLVDSLAQCARLGELQHAPSEQGRALELGAYCAQPPLVVPPDLVVCDFTGLGVEDLAIAELALSRLTPA